MVVRRRPGPQPAAQAAPRPRRGAGEAAERGFARFAWNQVKRDFGLNLFEPVEIQRRLAFLDALDARLGLSEYHPVIRCVAVGLGFAASTAVALAICCTTEGRNLANLLLLGGVLHKLANRPRGVPVHWESFLAAGALPAFLLFSRSKFFEENEGLVSLVLPPLLFLLLLGWFIFKLATRPRGAEVDWWPLIILGCLFLVPCVLFPCVDWLVG